MYCTVADTMVSDSSAFSCLPQAVRDSILQQAFRQLDQRHLFGVAPLVCRLWHQLASSIITSLDVKLSSQAAAEQLSLWIRNHRDRLDSMEVQMNNEGWHCQKSAFSCILQALGAASMLRKLAWKFNMKFGYASLSVLLPSLTTLTRLSISHVQLQKATLASLLQLTNLRSLSLCHTDVIAWWEPFSERISTSLVKLTYLDFRGTPFPIKGLLHLRSLPELQELLLTEVDPSDVSQLVGLPIISIGIRIEEFLGPETMSQTCSWLKKYSGQLKGLGICNPQNAHPLLIKAPGLPLLELAQMKSLVLERVLPNLGHLPMLTQLTELVMYQCDLDAGEVCKLTSLSALQCLGFSWGALKGETGPMEVLARAMPALTRLRLMGSNAVHNAVLTFGHRVISTDESGRAAVVFLRPLSVAELSA